jgi:ATP-dependent RNA helicase DeaD
LELPSIQAVNDVRIAKFKDQISATIAQGELEQFQAIIEDFEHEKNIPAIEIAAALAKIARGNVPLLLDKNKREPKMEMTRSDDRPIRERTDRQQRDRGDRGERSARPSRPERERSPRISEPGMQSYRIEVGHDHGVKPGNIVGAIANEANIDSKNIGRIEIYDDFSVLDLPSDLPKEVMEHLKKVWVAGQQLKISVDGLGQSSVSAPVPLERSVPKKKEKPAEFASPVISRRLGSNPSIVDHAGIASQPTLETKPVEIVEPKVKPKKEKSNNKSKFAVQSYRIEVGRKHDVTASSIVAAIAAGASLEPKHIGRIDIFDTYSVLDLPEGMPQPILDNLRAAKLAGQQLKISHVGAGLINQDKAEQVVKKKSTVSGEAKKVIRKTK